MKLSLGNTSEDHGIWKELGSTIEEPLGVRETVCMESVFGTGET